MRTSFFKRLVLVSCITVLFLQAAAQAVITKTLHTGWRFAEQGTNQWRTATVPGTVHTDLMRHKIIADPYYANNERKDAWVETRNWQYETQFVADKNLLSRKQIDLVFDGLDTYADVWVNGQWVLRADNMFRQWRANVKTHLKPGNNRLQILFYSAKNKVDSLAKSNLPLVIPDNPRLYARKAQYHFGWDWGPTIVTSGIYKNVYVEAYNSKPQEKPFTAVNNVQLVQEPDAHGKTFYFKIDGKPVYMKGANYIPSDVFNNRMNKAEYRRVLQMAKDANMNMIRVWGGGVYEDDAFYQLCDEMGLYVWQDFMFAGAMVPTDDAFFENVKQEVFYQVKRLRKYKSIVVWCGNNEVDEAWNNWGWQKQFNLHGADSAKVWQAYKRLFRDSIPAWLQQLDGTRPYVSTSPMHGWGRPQSLTEGDSHYWGVWWGLQDFEIFEEKTGRFVSEYGMIGMPTLALTEKYTPPADRYLFSPSLKTHQKHPTGYENMHSYVHRYFLDSTKAKQLSLDDYTYLMQCLQYYAFKNMIAIHRSKEPYNMGTLLWQLNDCWPVASWSITDYSRKPKAAWYAVKNAYAAARPQRDAQRPIQLQLQKPDIRVQVQGKKIMVHTKQDAKYVYLHIPGTEMLLSDNYFDLKAGETKTIFVKDAGVSPAQLSKLKVKSLWDVVGGK